MKKIFTLAAAAMMMAATNAQSVITLDLNNPANPETIEFGDNGAWTGTYNDQDYTFIEFTPFAFSHLISAARGAECTGTASPCARTPPMLQPPG